MSVMLIAMKTYFFSGNRPESLSCLGGIQSGTKGHVLERFPSNKDIKGSTGTCNSLVSTESVNSKADEYWSLDLYSILLPYIFTALIFITTLVWPLMTCAPSFRDFCCLACN